MFPETDYLKYFGLKEAPFALTPDPHFLFPTPENQEVLRGVLRCVRRGEGYAVISGDIGTGKTTICRRFLELLEQDNAETALLVNPFLNEIELLRALLKDFGIVNDQNVTGNEVQTMVDQIADFLTQNWRQGKRCVAVVDESQNLPISALEQLRILGNLETNKEKLLQIVLIGQKEFLHELKHPRLTQLVQRISNWYHLNPIPRKMIVDYFNFRLEQAGLNRALPCSDSTANQIFRLTKGYPRLMNILFDRILEEVCASQRWHVDTDIVNAAKRKMPMGNDTPELLHSKSSKRRFNSKALAVTAGLCVIAGSAGYFVSELLPLKKSDTAEFTGVPWAVSLGKFQTEEEAEAAIRKAAAELPDPAPQGYWLAVRENDNNIIYQARLGNFNTRKKAQLISAALAGSWTDIALVKGISTERSLNEAGNAQ